MKRLYVDAKVKTHSSRVPLQFKAGVVAHRCFTGECYY